ncbi:hypothetical protein ACFXAZ_22940 [Streptomyces sp. NPDC059477]
MSADVEHGVVAGRVDVGQRYGGGQVDRVEEGPLRRVAEVRPVDR